MAPVDGTTVVWVFFAALVVVLTSKGIHSWWLYIVAKIRIVLFLKNQKRKIDVPSDLHRTDLSPVDIGLLPSPYEYELESPCKNVLERCDGVHFIGVDSEGNTMDVCINRIQENMALVWVYMKLSDGSAYKMPFCADSRKSYISGENIFSSSGLQIKCLSPLRKWRISFNGLLQKVKIGEDELIHTKFSFVWLAMSVVQELNFTSGTKELADAFANEHSAVDEEDLKRFWKLRNQYEQWGQMIGTLNMTGYQEKELYFWSSRTRIMDAPLWNEELRHAKFYMYFMDGIPIKMESLTIKGFLSDLTSGFTITAYGASKPISSCTFNIHQLKEDVKELEFSINLGGETKRVHVIFAEDCSFHIGPELQTRLTLRPFKVHMSGCDDGYGILHHSSRSNVQIEKTFHHPPVLLVSPGSIPCEKFVVCLDEDSCKSQEIAGGKGSSLALLSELSKKTQKFTVPKGLVISTKAFEAHLNTNKNVRDAIQRLKDVSCKKIKADLKTECSKCASTFLTTCLSDNLKKEIESSLLNLYDSLENARFSVRSSACGEDSEDLSAAGQMLTILGIKGINNVFQAIIQCWSSKFSFEYVQYSRQNGQSILSSMAVVVQEMVPSEFSGVLFSVHPVSGDPSHVYITANYGLGETVVSALADPDTIVLVRGQDESLQVYSKHMGSKKKQVFMKGDGLEQKNLEFSSEDCCLTDDWALNIGSIGILVESCFCGPRDIEWAVYKDQIYLLQARPITTLHTETDFELIHDQDTPVRSVNDFWTRANTGEVFLGATSPLGISLVVGGMDIDNHRAHVSREKCYEEFCPYFFHILPVTHKQITLNIVDMLLRNNEKEITAVQRAFEVALFGRTVITQEMRQVGIKKYGYASRNDKYWRILFTILALYKVPKAMVSVGEQLSGHILPLETYTSCKKAWDGIFGHINMCIAAFRVHGLATYLSSYFNMMLMTILAKGKKDWDTELYCDFATMMSSCSEVESADVPKSLQELAKAIAVNLGTEFSSLPSDVAYHLLKNDEGSAGQQFEEFIQRHGHRCVKEFDIYSKSWGMQPESFIPTLQNMVNSPNILDVVTKEALNTQDILSKLKTPISFFNKKLLQIFIPLSRKYVREREKTKSMVIKTVNFLRKCCYRLGELMVAEGLLPEVELVFFLTLEEVRDILDTQKPGLVPKAIRRMRLHQQLNDLQFPEIMQGIPRPIQVQQDTSNFSSSFTLKGTPVCQGKVKSKAVVVLCLEEASQIKNGDILITHATDIGWSPYFPLLSGVVTVLGGLISHGAVVAREYGLPCVVGVENATAAFKTGDTVMLNGTDGTVTKILDEKN